MPQKSAHHAALDRGACGSRALPPLLQQQRASVSAHAGEARLHLHGLDCDICAIQWILDQHTAHHGAQVSAKSEYPVKNTTLLFEFRLCRSVKQHEKELAASIMAACLSVGMVIGSLVSMAFVQML